MQYPESRSMKSQAGFNLLEVLVAVVILSIGFLGMAGLHVFGLRANLDAQSRTQATFLAQEIMDRMRANWSVNALGRYDQIAPVQVPACSLAGGNGCIPDQMAQNDMFEWTQALQRLPGPADAQGVRRGRGIVCVDNVPDDPTVPITPITPNNPSCEVIPGVVTTYAIKIWWDQNRDDVFSCNDPNNPINECFVVTFQP